MCFINTKVVKIDMNENCKKYIIETEDFKCYLKLMKAKKNKKIKKL